MPKTMTSSKMETSINLQKNNEREETKIAPGFGGKVVMPNNFLNQQRYLAQQDGKYDKIKTLDKKEEIVDKQILGKNKEFKLQKQSSNTSSKKTKSGWSLRNIFSWGCKGKANEASAPKTKIRSPEYKPGMKLGQRDIKSEQNALSYNDNSLLYDDTNWKYNYMQNKQDDVKESSGMSKNICNDLRIVKKVASTHKSIEHPPDSDLDDISESSSQASEVHSQTTDKHTKEGSQIQGNFLLSLSY